MNETQIIRFVLNGEDVEAFAEPDDTLLDVLRIKLMRTGAKKGCGEGECGACTVLFNGMPVASCILPAMKANNQNVITIEGIAAIGQLHPLQEAFIEVGAVQCGFCTPGVILSAKSLLDRESQPSEEMIKRELSGHLCRCTGYAQFVNAVQLAAKRLNTAGDA